MIEKLLSVAVELRQQENFDALMGVLAGLNAQPIFRLSETFDLVTSKLDGDARLQPQRAIQPDGDSQRLPKKLRSLNRLMSASKAFAAYRLALANSGITMIPYLGVHLQDLTIVNESKSDRRDGLVNWSKFSQLGKSAAIVLDCAKVAPKLPVDKTIERCVLDVPLLDEDVRNEEFLVLIMDPNVNPLRGTAPVHPLVRPSTTRRRQDWHSQPAARPRQVDLCCYLKRLYLESPCISIDTYCCHTIPRRSSLLVLASLRETDNRE